MNKFFDNLKTQSEENPTLALAIGAAVVTAAAKLIKAGNESRNSKAWAKEVDRRAMKDRIK
jgi:hypothetical protein